MASDEYQLMSRKELVELKDQLRKMKDGSASPDKSVQAVMSSLQKTMLEMISIFREAAENLKEDGSDIGLSKKLEEISTKLDILIDQNEKLAEGIVMVADLVKGSASSSASAASARPEPAPLMPGAERFIPMQAGPEQPQPAPGFYSQPPPPPPMTGPAPTPPPMQSRPPQKRQFPNFFP